MIDNNEFQSVFATGFYTKETVEFYANKIGSIVKHQGFSVCSLSFENEKKKTIECSANEGIRVVFEFILDKRNQ